MLQTCKLCILCAGDGIYFIQENPGFRRGKTPRVCDSIRTKLFLSHLTDPTNRVVAWTEKRHSPLNQTTLIKRLYCLINNDRQIPSLIRNDAICTNNCRYLLVFSEYSQKCTSSIISTKLYKQAGKFRSQVATAKLFLFEKRQIKCSILSLPPDIYSEIFRLFGKLHTDYSFDFDSKLPNLLKRK